jgi:putative addiction module component (TIGR02574 family)
MLPTIQDLGIAQLSNDEKLQIVSAIIRSLSPEQELVIPEHHREEVYRRLEIADANPGVGKSWKEVETRILGGQ